MASSRSPPAARPTCRARATTRVARGPSPPSRTWSPNGIPRLSPFTPTTARRGAEAFLGPLLEESRRRLSSGDTPLFQSHMFDGSTLPLEENLPRSGALLRACANLGVVLELEVGVVGGSEDDVSGEGVAAAKRYTTPNDLLRVTEVLGDGDRGRYLLAATFGNVHGVESPEAWRSGRRSWMRASRHSGRPGRARGSGTSSPQQRLIGVGRARGGELRRRQAQRRHRRPVRLHARGRGPRAGRLRRRAQGRRRGWQQGRL